MEQQEPDQQQHPQPQQQHPQQQQYPAVQQYPAPYYPAGQPTVMMAAPQPYPGGAYQHPGVQFVPVQQQGLPMTQTVETMPGKYGPAHNLILTAIVTIACGLLNLTSLMIGGPAVVCAIMAYNALQAQRYSTTKSLGYTAIVLSVVNIAYTGVVTTLVVGLTIGLYCNGYYSYYYHSYRRNCR